jgi:hypothetical protein
MGVHFLDSGRPVRVNHILNPDFEVDASYWRPLNSHSTISVVTGHQFSGGKALKIIGDGSGTAYGATYDGPHILVSDIKAPLATGWVSIVASLSTDTPNTIGYIGGFSENAAGTVLSSGTRYLGSMTATPKRRSMSLGDYIWGLADTDYIRPTIHFEHSGPGVYYIDAVMVTSDYSEGYGEESKEWPSFIVGSRTDGEDGLAYAWTGAPHTSTSTGTALRWVDLPETGEIGEDYTITGDAFIPNEMVRVWVMPEDADNTYWDTTANADGTFEYTFTMPVHTGGTTVVQVAAGGWNANPYAKQDVAIPVPPPRDAPETTPEQLVNYFLDPRLKVTEGMTVLAKNFHHNPSPTSSLDGYTPAGAATIELDPTSSIKGPGGIKVTSPDNASGIAVTTQEHLNDEDVTFTVYVRARTAMTVTGEVGADYTIWEQTDGYGWGDYGWDEPFTFSEGWAHTFAPGEVQRFRVMPRVKRDTSGGTFPTNVAPYPDIGWVFKLLGTGTFDVDAVWHGSGVNDGVDPVWDIPNAPLWFSGDSPDTAEYIYVWEGAPGASPSLKKGHQTKYLRSSSGYMAEGYEMTYAITLPTGETAGAAQSSWDESSGDTTYFTADGKADGVGQDLRLLGLTEGKSYAISFDYISMMENYIEGYNGGLWDNLYVEAGDAYIGYPMHHPERMRISLPFTVAGEAVDASAVVYRNWYTGYHAFTNVAVNEIDFHMPQFRGTVDWGEPGFGEPSVLDLTALGVEAGKTYIATADTMLEEGAYYRFEYQTVEGGPWTTLAESLYDEAYTSYSYVWEFTVPAEATACRFAFASNGGFYSDLFSKPPDFFDGDTPDSGGYVYSWAGLPGESASIRTLGESPTPGPYLEARVVVDGTLVEVDEIRVSHLGRLFTVNDFRKIAL